MSDFLDLLRCFVGTSLKTKGSQKMLPVTKVIEGVEALEMENARLREEKHRLLRRHGQEACRDCGYPLDNDDPDQGGDQWYCPRCRGDAEIKRLRMILAVDG